MKKLPLAFAAALASTTLAGCDRVRDNQTGIVTDYGRVAQVVNEPSEKGIVWLISLGKELIKYTTRNQEVTASTDPSEEAVKNRQILRTKDQYQIEGTVLVRFNLKTDNEARFIKVFTELTSNEEAQGESPADGYKNDLQRIVLIATSAAISQYNVADLSTKAEEISVEITKQLQKIVNARKWPFEISSTAPNIGPTKAANALFEENAQLDARNAMATKRQLTAENEANSAKAVSAATVGIFSKFREAGAGDEAAVTLTCLEIARTGGRVAGPCTPNTAMGMPAPRR